MFLVIGHFLVGVAAGAWLFGLLFAYVPVSLRAFCWVAPAAWRILLFSVGPSAFWKMVRHVSTAWIARGFVGLALFLVGAVLYLPPLVITDWPWSSFRRSHRLAG